MLCVCVLVCVSRNMVGVCTSGLCSGSPEKAAC